MINKVNKINMFDIKYSKFEYNINKIKLKYDSIRTHFQIRLAFLNKN